ncbi:YcxB family protein [Streptomyces sp. NPDC002580]|uniref:YcxB family protein n=1 Tax=Streptomyces sp. NPDC002580 TaxID=3364653 RepID=UPI0036B62D03
MDITRGGGSSQEDTDRGAAVELNYRLTAEDFEEALRARAWRSRAGRTQMLVVPLAVVVAMVVFWTFEDTTLPVGIFTLVLSVAVTSWSAVRGLRTAGRRMFSVTESSYGQCHVVADERGLVTTGERASNTVEWTVHREYLETPGLFVLLSGDLVIGVAVLPKRGARDDADVDRFRAILDQNLKRL